MNDPGLLTIAVWRTNNARRQHRTEQLCKNYALSRLQPALYAGRLSARERHDFEAKMCALLSGKRDLLHFFTSCRSCAAGSSAYETIGAHYQATTFEIV